MKPSLTSKALLTLYLLVNLVFPHQSPPAFAASAQATTQNPLASTGESLPLQNIKQAAVGGHHTCALTLSGGVKCWGDNTFGQLGRGETTGRHMAVELIGLTSGVRAIAAGGIHTCALTVVGKVKCWGDNITGQLGDGTKLNRFTPVEVVELDNVQAVVP